MGANASPARVTLQSGTTKAPANWPRSVGRISLAKRDPPASRTSAGHRLRLRPTPDTAAHRLPGGSHPARLHAHPGRGPFQYDLAAEAVELRRAAAGSRLHVAGRLDEPGTLDQPAEVLLVQVRTEDRLHCL